jgi:UDP-N-acetylmuramate dehydrogenase
MIVATNHTPISARFLPAHRLADYTAYGVGGAADWYFAPTNTRELSHALAWAKAQSIAVFVLGNGANLLISDAGFRGLVIHMKKCCQELSRLGSNGIRAGCGRPLLDLVEFASACVLDGISRLMGIPGTIGGALHMNAGAFDEEIGDVVESVSAFTTSGEPVTVSQADAAFAYRQASGLAGLILTETTLRLKKGGNAELAETNRTILARRQAKQPLEHPSCGSVFKRPAGDYAGRLIEAAGLRGHRIGGAMVAEKHANFIVNTGSATAADLFQLMRFVRDEVERQFSVRLEPEVQLVGFEEEL